MIFFRLWHAHEHSSLNQHTTSLHSVLTSKAAAKGTDTTMAAAAKEDKILAVLRTVQDTHSSFSEGIRTNQQTDN